MNSPVAGTSTLCDIEDPSAPDLHSATDAYAARFAGTVGVWMLERQAQALRSVAARWPGATVLDVGGGHGQTAPVLADAGHDVTVLATDDRGLDRINTLDNPRIATATGSLNALPFADRSFDIAVSFRIMAHIPDWQAYLAELCRVSARGVIIDFAIPGGANALEPLFFGLKKSLEGNTRRFETQSVRDVSAAFSAHGFAKTGQVGQFVLPMVVHRKLKAPGLSRGMEALLAGIGLAHLVGTPVVYAAQRQEHAGG